MRNIRITEGSSSGRKMRETDEEHSKIKTVL